MKLTGPQFRQLSDALRLAFNSFELGKMLRFELGRDLESEAGGQNHEEVVINLIGKAQRTGWLHELIVAAKTQNPTPALVKISAELQPMINAETRDHFNVIFVDNNSVLVNRIVLRKSLKQLAEAELTGGRILVVNGPPMSGKSYSIELIAYLRRALNSFKLVWIDLKTIAGEVRPEHVALAIVDQMKLDRKTVVPELDQEQDSRWVQSFCYKLQGELGESEDPWWVVMDGFNHARLSTSVNDLVKELSGRIRLTLPGLRMVLLSYPDTLPTDVERVALRETLSPIDDRDLITFFSQVYLESNMTYFPKDIAERIGEVRRAVDPSSSKYMESLGAEVARVSKQIIA